MTTTIEKRSYLGDTPVLKINAGKDISGATNITLKVLKPDAVSEEDWTIVSIEGTDIFRYNIGATDFDEVGTYKFQVEYTIGTFTGRTRTVKWFVYAHYKGEVT